MQTHDRVALNNLMSTGQNRPKLRHAVLNIAVTEKVRMRVLKENSRIILASLKTNTQVCCCLRERAGGRQDYTNITIFYKTQPKHHVHVTVLFCLCTGRVGECCLSLCVVFGTWLFNFVGEGGDTINSVLYLGSNLLQQPYLIRLWNTKQMTDFYCISTLLCYGIGTVQPLIVSSIV